MNAVPHDESAEEAVLASALIEPTAATDAERFVRPEDFYRPAHGHIFAAITSLRAAGHRPDGVTVADQLRRDGLLDAVGLDRIRRIAGYPVSTSSAARHSMIVAEHAWRRRLMAAAEDLRSAALAGEPSFVLDEHVARLRSIDLPTSQPAGLTTFDELLDHGGVETDWIVEGCLRRDWRVTIVAAEGAGKSTLLQQAACCASQGVHPFSHTPGHPPVKVLIIDTENPAGRIAEVGRPIRTAVTGIAEGWDDSRLRIWHQPSGLDLRTRRDRSAFERVLADVRPDLVVGGPVYKLASRGRGEGWDEVAQSLQAILDDLRTRFAFALLLEDHAPQADVASGHRDLRPFGSSLWLRWPEIGIKLVRTKDNPGGVDIQHWRGARMRHDWPNELRRGGVLPWTGYWDE